MTGGPPLQRTHLAAALAACLLGYCSAPPQPLHPEKTAVVTTISTLASLVASVGGSKIELRTLVPVGASPETYDPKPSDLIALAHARLLIENGAGLERWLKKLLRSAAGPDLRIIVLSDGLPVAGRADPNDRESGNPHLWLDPVLAQAYVRKIARALAEVDPPNARYYAANAREQSRRLEELDRWVRSKIETIPLERRAAITFHDAWYYFNRRYGIRTLGAIEPSPGQEPSAEHFAQLVALAKSNHLRAVFAEPQFSPKLARQLAESAQIKTVTDLYDDTLGTTPELSTYEGMMRHNVDTITAALNS